MLFGKRKAASAVVLLLGKRTDRKMRLPQAGEEGPVDSFRMSVLQTLPLYTSQLETSVHAAM